MTASRGWCHPCSAAWQRQYRATRGGLDAVRRADRKSQLKRKFGMTVEQYDALLLAQDGHCAICPSTTELCVDHNHTTGVVRGILCNPCNKALGFLKDDPARLAAAIEYLSTRTLSKAR